MSDFAFVPRSILKRKAPTVLPPQSATTQDSIISRAETSNVSPSPSKEPNVKSKFTNDDILTLLRLCLSRYSIWLDPKLFRLIQKSREGYVPIQYLLEHVSPLCELENRPSELEITHALRSIDTDVENNFELQMIIHGPSRNEWLSPAQGNHARAAGLFEIRRRDYEEVIRSINEVSEIGKKYWDSRTVYVEHLPVTYRTKHAIAQYISHLVINAQRNSGESSKRDYPVQSVTFPPHHSDSEGRGLPRYKGFVFVVLDSCSSAKALCDAYPWNSSDPIRQAQSRERQTNEHKDSNHDPSEVEAEAAKFGTRTLSKPSWDKLKDEYLNYQKTILALNASTDKKGGFGLAATSQTNFIPEKDMSPVVQDQTGDSRDLRLPRTEVTLNKPYPENCLVFVKNVHAQTNKTTLRQLFTSGLSSPTAIDYVDFTKGVDSCHLRLINSSEAAKLVSRFGADAKPGKAQLDALDNQGGSPTADRPALVTELVQGKREDLYWEKVPQKLREKALTAARLESQNDSLRDNNDGETKNKAKRRKRS